MSGPIISRRASHYWSLGLAYLTLQLLLLLISVPVLHSIVGRVSVFVTKLILSLIFEKDLLVGNKTAKNTNERASGLESVASSVISKKPWADQKLASLMFLRLQMCSSGRTSHTIPVFREADLLFPVLVREGKGVEPVVPFSSTSVLWRIILLPCPQVHKLGGNSVLRRCSRQ